MAKLELKVFPEPVLREKCAPVEEFGEELEALALDMAETMWANDGVGLAAPQIGVAKRLLVLDVAPAEERGQSLLVLANPRIVERDGEIEWEEGCLSVPGMTVKVKRSVRVVVEGQDVEGNDVRVEGEELPAVVLQHEMDHLDGVLMFDYLSPLRRRMALKEYRKQFPDQDEQ